MDLHALLGRRISLFILPALLLVPGAAMAQLDDPGMAPPPPKAAPPPPPAAAPTPPPVGATRALPAPSYPGSETPVSEDVKEETVDLPPSKGEPANDDTWEASHLAPSLAGYVGLLHMQTAEKTRPLSFRVGTHFQGFTQDSFLVAGSGTTPGDSNSRFLGDLTVGITGPDVTFLRNLELYLGILNSSNQNKRTDSQRTDPSVILALADVSFGLKGSWELAPSFLLGGNVGVRFFNSISGVTANFDATNVDLNLVGTFDARKINASVPLRLHLNFGALVDNSLSLLPAGQCANSTGNDACIRSRVVETFAYGLGTTRLRGAFALDLPFRWHYGEGSIFGFEPFVEYHLDGSVGKGDATVSGALESQATSDKNKCAAGDTVCLQKVTDFKKRIENQVQQYLTIGLRMKPVVGLIIDLGIDIGLQSPGFQFGPPLPAWNVIAGLSYAYDITGGAVAKSKLTTRTITRRYEIMKSAPEGKVSGVVRDAVTKKVLSGAQVRYSTKGLTPQATAEDGSFVSYGLPPGPVQMTVTANDYEPASGNITIEANQVKPLDVALKPLPPKESKLKIHVVDDKNVPLAGATAHIIGANATRDAAIEGDQLVATLPAGDYAVAVEAPNFLAKEKQVSMVAGQDKEIDVDLAKRPKTSHVTITKDQIVIKGTIHFQTNEAKILPDGLQILNEVGDVLAKNPQIKKVMIEGHTDNSGNEEKNLQLSKKRAAAVLEYLIKSGIHNDRLTSEGYGQARPLVPNTTPGERAKNRRVEFHITEQVGAP